MARIVTLDFETYYDKDYSLTKMSTAEYIHDPRFEIIGVAVSVNGGEPRWHSATTLLDVAAFLSSFGLEKKGTICVAHNALFDGAILEWKLGIRPWKYFCTMMGSRPFVTPFTGRMSLDSVTQYLGVGQKGDEVKAAMGKRLAEFDKEQLLRYAAYCIQDVILTYEVAKKLLAQFPNDEISLVDLTIKKYTRPKLRLDKNVISQALRDEIELKESLLVAAKVADPSQLRSDAKFAKLLQAYAVTPPQKISPTTGKKTYAFARTDHEFIRLKHHANPTVAALVEARLAHKSSINETRLSRFKAIAAVSPDSELAVPLLYYGAHPGRFSGLDKLNLQNLGRKSPLRRAIVAPPGYKVVAGDLSQIEARINACLAGQNDLVELFRYYDDLGESERDVYCEFGDKVFPIKVTKAYESERFVAKCGVLSLGYQSGPTKFFETMRSYGVKDITERDAAMIVNTYRLTYPKIKAQWYTMEDIIDCMASGTGRKYGPIEVMLGMIRLPNGMYLQYPELTKTHDNAKYKFGGMWRDLYGGKLTENVVQALARIVMTTAELRLARAGARAALSVHDELVYVVPEQHVPEFTKALRKALTAPVPWMPNLPVNCEIGVGDSYAEAK